MRNDRISGVKILIEKSEFLVPQHSSSVQEQESTKYGIEFCKKSCEYRLVYATSRMFHPLFQYLRSCKFLLFL